MKQAIIFSFLFFLMIHSVFAIDCNLLEHKEICEEIQNSEISQEEKDYLMRDIIHDFNDFPSHSFVKEWNTNIITSEAPENTQTFNKRYIQNAWVKVFAVMPSILENNTLFHSGNGEILTGYNHDIIFPKKAESDDCRTDYSIENVEEEIKVFQNNDFIGEGKLVNFSLSNDAVFKSEYNIKAKIRLDHFELEEECCDEECEQKCESCEFSHTTYDEENLKILSENFNIKYYNINLSEEYLIKDQYLGTTKAEFSGKNYTSMHLTYSNSYFKEFNYFYSIVWDVLPYYVLTVKAEKNQKIEFDNLIYEGKNPYTIFVKDTKACELIVYDHFKGLKQNCNTSYENIGIGIKTDKLIYKNDETIKINVVPYQNFTLTYANQTYTINNYLELKAVYPYNKISILHNGRSYDKIIHVKNNEPLMMLFSLSIFGIVNYAIFGLIKKYWGVLS